MMENCGPSSSLSFLEASWLFRVEAETALCFLLNGVVPKVDSSLDFQDHRVFGLEDSAFGFLVGDGVRDFDDRRALEIEVGVAGPSPVGLFSLSTAGLLGSIASGCGDWAKSCTGSSEAPSAMISCELCSLFGSSCFVGSWAISSFPRSLIIPCGTSGESLRY